MSSPTVLFVLKQVIENNPDAKKGSNIFSAAFGPGLSVETMALEYV
jgi:predicted naringenin-chalcone synthase